MNTIDYQEDDIIYALATPLAPSALAIIRISGAGCKKLLAPHFSKPSSLIKGKSHTLLHGKILSYSKKETIDEVLLSLFDDKRGYTGEESIEIACHGSLFGIEAIFTLLSQIGFRSAAPGEFTFRAFKHGRLDLTQAEAVMEIVDSHSQKAHSLALSRLEGDLFKRMDYLKKQTLQAMSSIEVQLDYAEDDFSDEVVFPSHIIREVKESLDSLIETYSVGKMYKEGALVVLAGSTNAGKSTLFNLLMKSERSIVSETHGTTRDFIEGHTVIGGIPITIFDTAGLRDSSDAVEMEGIKRSRYLLEKAHVIVLLVDADEAELQMSHHLNIIDDPRCITVYNKSDIALRAIPEGVIAISAKNGQGFGKLEEHILAKIKKDMPIIQTEALIIESKRQHDHLVSASSSLKSALEMGEKALPLDLIAVEVQEALSALGELTGEVTSFDILEQIFSGFCVGK
ncbi:MAG: tRNA uridine-5-carboxymethylaminomethyl(34) synthesis GTPase MnmE [Spirochaetia bacterium]|nr:tRNA uridine-5-carboxymethylaminomethyl(34) synthesis GTPase MnmE [Spirochaetia bacterium]